MMQQKTTILWNRPVGPDCYRMGLACQQGYLNAVPGQFVMLHIGPGLDPLLRRPFSIFGRIGPPDHPEGIELLYKIVGRGTRRMAGLAPGEGVDLLGPLGRGFSVEPVDRRFYLAAGGIGVAPIRFLALHLLALGVPPTACRLFLGARRRSDLLCREEFARLGIATIETTDDGSAGEQCLITDPLAAAVAEQPPDGIFACGPHGMLQCVAGIAIRNHVRCQVSLETVMACGVGACLGCAVRTTGKQEAYRHACIDGPVFDADQIYDAFN